MFLTDLRKKYGVSRAQFCRDFHIPIRTVEAWEAGVNKMSEWLQELLTDAIIRKYEKDEKEG